ncbi:hypothetical protein SAMN05443252_10185 [Bacillus sp. OV322]|nr:hypothetical protein SAMN05443252_10185 [Bacillus sp. OV322]
MTAAVNNQVHLMNLKADDRTLTCYSTVNFAASVCSSSDN